MLNAPQTKDQNHQMRGRKDKKPNKKKSLVVPLYKGNPLQRIHTRQRCQAAYKEELLQDLPAAEVSIHTAAAAAKESARCPLKWR